ncbi:DUF805 domain-containing protein [Pedobacter africanus]|uniref:Uncharacterized membrane protein YhaH, DUF805 family n=1 Tax=Pedobacter africanus TaxID=151894 RepID=A0A1W2CPS6_9SPHI|nr:DUF805 domain-containing protein [Pedobacter africanus]SMC86872.1 Uncharacterized membrane protein YhaH, DUF805 family [Pedobacter africanus]
MFQNPFSFEGRIRRLEYCLSQLIYLCYVFAVGFIFGAIGLIDDTESPKNSLTILIAILPGIYFLWAQGAKRCHDRGNSGWYQLIPFYGFWMCFAPGDTTENEYGDNPKLPKQYYDPFAVDTGSDGTGSNMVLVEPIDDVDEDGIIKEK